MQPLTKHDLQQAVQQLRDSILGQVATKNDVNNATTAVSQRMCNQNDIQRAVDASRERFMGRLGQPLRQQQIAMQQMIVQLDQINKRLTALELRLGIIHGNLQSVRSGTEAVVHRTAEPAKPSMLSQMFT